jgi:hypothetical protein
MLPLVIRDGALVTVSYQVVLITQATTYKQRTKPHIVFCTFKKSFHRIAPRIWHMP